MSRLNVTPLPSRGPYGPQEELKLFFRMKRALHHTVSQKQTLPRLPPTETCSDTTSVLKAPCICPARATMLCPPCTGSCPPPRLIWQAPSLSCVQACLLQAQPPITSVSQGTCPSAGDLSYTRHSSLSRIHWWGLRGFNAAVHARLRFDVAYSLSLSLCEQDCHLPWSLAHCHTSYCNSCRIPSSAPSSSLSARHLVSLPARGRGPTACYPSFPAVLSSGVNPSVVSASL